MKKVKIKGEEISLYLSYCDRYYSILAFNNKYDNIGMLNFIYPHNDSKTNCWLSAIKVKNPEYLNRGVGNEMIKMFEKFITKKGCKNIMGKYYPEGEGAHLSKDFYARHNYEIYNDGYQWFIEKKLDLELQNH